MGRLTCPWCGEPWEPPHDVAVIQGFPVVACPNIGPTSIGISDPAFDAAVRELLSQNSPSLLPHSGGRGE